MMVGIRFLFISLMIMNHGKISGQIAGGFVIEKVAEETHSPRPPFVERFAA